MEYLEFFVYVGIIVVFILYVIDRKKPCPFCRGKKHPITRKCPCDNPNYIRVEQDTPPTER